MNASDLKIGMSVWYWPTPAEAEPRLREPQQGIVTGVGLSEATNNYNVTVKRSIYTSAQTLPVAQVFATKADACAARVQSLIPFANDLADNLKSLSLVVAQASINELENATHRKAA